MLSDYFLNEVYCYFESKLRSETSKQNYRIALKSITDFCEKDFLELTEKDTAAYAKALASGKLLNQYGKPYSERTSAVRLSALRSIATYIEENDDVTGPDGEPYHSPFVRLDVEDTPELELSRIPSVEDVDKMLVAAPTDAIRLMLCLIIRCGLSTSELIRLRPSDVIADDNDNLALRLPDPFGELRSDGTREPRYVKVPDDIRSKLITHLATMKDSEALFLNKRGGAYSETVFCRMIRAVCEAAGLSVRWTAQDLRNFCVVCMLKSKAEPLDVVEYLGILPRWISRYDGVLENFAAQPCDLSILQIKC